MKQLTLSAKFALGFGLIFLIIALLLGFIVLRVNTMQSLSENLGRELVPVLIASQELTGAVGEALDGVTSYALSSRQSYLEKWETNYLAANQAGQVLLTGLSGPRLADMRSKVTGLLDTLSGLQKDTLALSSVVEDYEKARVELTGLSERGLNLLEPLARTGSETQRRQALAAQAQLWRRAAILWESDARRNLEAFNEWPAAREDFGAFTGNLGRDLNDLYDRIDSLKDELGRLNSRKDQAQSRLEDSGRRIMADLNEFNRQAHRLTDNVLAMSTGAGRQITRSVLAGLLVALILTVALITVLMRSTVRPLNGVTGLFEEAAAEVTNTADHLSRSSRLLAKGVSENTAAVLEAISSLEEMLNMAKRNAGHSAQAKDLMDEAKNYVQLAKEAMDEISKAMDEIRDSSRASSQIIKTVEEIAFQTNILALNAAVEAARAGEAGVGFAVVADEVRNLANRSAEAAKSTAVILAGSMASINQGAELVQNAEESFSSMVATSDQMGGIVEEIAQASQSQVQDIQNIHQSIALMDKVTQENAAGAGETQSLSTNLTQQAALLSEALAEMTVILKGQGPGRALPGPRRPVKPAAPPLGERRGANPDQGFRLGEHLEKPALKSSVVDSGKKSRLEEAIPMDDDDF